MPVITCHLYKSLTGTFGHVAQVATEETMKDKYYSRLPLFDIDIPETGIHEVTLVCDDIIDFCSFVHCGLVTKEQAELGINPPQYKQDVTGWNKLAWLLTSNQQAKGFVQQPFPLDNFGYKNMSPTYYFPNEFYIKQGIDLASIPELY